MQAKYISYPETQSFSQIVLDYLGQKESLSDFYRYSTDYTGFEKAIAERKVLTDRAVLVEVLQAQYADLKSYSQVAENIKLLADDKTFTITTGHQLNLFTGPLYFIYKIVSTINLAKDLKVRYPDYNFVPIYWMATEDHDFEEINHVKVEDKMITWNTHAAGATGKISTADLKDVLASYHGYLGISENADKLASLIESAYTKHATLADATRELVDGLFGKQGLVCLDADEPRLKKQFASIISEDITGQHSFENIEKSNAALEVLGYKPQVNPREINFFYMIDGLRERITETDASFEVLNTSVKFTKNELLAEVEQYPERFSPNVVMRPVYQELILPNLAYIGGGAEVTYWLQLKANFDHYAIPYPVLLLRNSALVIDKRSEKKMQILGINHRSLFKANEILKNEWVKAHVDTYISLQDEERSIRAVFDQIKLNAYKIDKTLSLSAESAKTRALKLLEALDKKMLRAEKRKHETSLSQVDGLKDKLFPSGVLQERVLNIAPMYVLYGDDFIDALLAAFRPLDRQFTIIYA